MNNNKIEPLVQLKQECIYCLYPLLGGEEVSLYRGESPLYRDWICHLSCVEFYSGNSNSNESNKLNLKNENEKENDS
jgi:hypothetical protein